MLIQSCDRNDISFGKLSEAGVLARSPLTTDSPASSLFNDENFQYIADNIVDMFGFAHGSVSARVETQDIALLWNDFDLNGRPDDGELSIQLTLNAQVNVYQRESIYSKRFMTAMAKTYGYPVIFGIVGHEIGHIIAHYALEQLEVRLVGGRPALVIVQALQPYWDELCADYLAGVVLGKAAPPLDARPLQAFLSVTQAGASHPSGAWRSMAVDMGSQWGRNNSPVVTDQVLSRMETQRQLLISFFQAYYSGVYAQVAPMQRLAYGELPNSLLMPANDMLGYL